MTALEESKEDGVNMEDRAGAHQKLYVEQLDRLRKILDGAQKKAKIIPDDPTNFDAFVHVVVEMTATIELLGRYVTVLEEELRKRQ